MALSREGVQQGVYGERVPRSSEPPSAPTGRGTPLGAVPIRPIGSTPGDKNLKLISGFDGLLSHLSAVNEEIRKTLRDARAGQMRAATYGSGGAETQSSVYSALGGPMPVAGMSQIGGQPLSAIGVGSLAGMTIANKVMTPPPGAGNVTEGTPAPTTGQDARAVAGAPKDDPHTLRNLIIGSRLGGRHESPEEAAAAAQEEEQKGMQSSRHAGQRRYQQYSHMYEKGTIAQQVGHFVRSTMENRIAKQTGLTKSPKGVWMKGAIPANAEEVSALSSKGGMAGKISQVGAGLEEGEGIGGAIAGAGGGAAAAAVGLPVAAVLAVNKGLNFATDQRRQNAQWQQIMGGSNAEGFKERLGSKLFGFGQKGFMGGGEAEKLYQGVAEIGYRGSERGAAQDFGLQNYSRYGMSVDDSLKLIKTSASTGQESLIGLDKALRAVTKSAREAGLSAHQYQQKFATTFAGVSARLPGGSTGAAPAIAAAVTSNLAQMGPSFQNVSMDPLATQTSQQRILAAEQGQTLNQYETGIAKDPVKAGRAMDTHIDRIAGFAINDAMKKHIAEKLAEWKGNKGSVTVTDAQFKELGQWCEAAPGAMDVQALVTILNGIGGLSGVDMSNAYEFVVRAYVHAHGLETAAKGQVTKSTPKTTHPASNANKTLQSRIKDDKGLQQEAKDIGLDPSYNPNTQTASDITGQKGEPSKKGKEHDTARAYLKQQTQTGVESPIVEQLLHRDNTTDRFTVTDKSGKKRTVSLHDAIDHYYDQLVSGEAVIEHGAGKGTTVAQATNLGPQSPEAVDQARKNETGAGAARGKIKDSGKDKGGGSGSVRIEAGPELKRLLKFSTGGNAYLTNPGYAGQPPDPQQQPNQAPTGYSPTP